MAQTIVTCVNICALIFVIAAGGYLASKNGWAGYENSDGYNWLLYVCFKSTSCFVKSVINFELFVYHRYFPFGINGVLGGSATVFFSYIGFDSVTATAEEVYSIFFVGSRRMKLHHFLLCLLVLLCGSSLL